MFGGLEMKGADDKAESTAEASNPVAPAPALSSFGFMNTAAPEPAPHHGPQPRGRASPQGLVASTMHNVIAQ